MPRRPTTPQTEPVIVIGAGPAGLATAGALSMAGIRAVVLDRAQAGASWRAHYDRLRLHTARAFSHLPGHRIPASEGRYVSRDGVVRYLEAYAERHSLDVHTGVEVSRVDREGDSWAIRSSAGDMRARQVVVATGYNHTPFVPDWPGADRFRGELVHAGRYRNGDAYAGKTVIVAGTGNTGAEIAVDLAERGAARVHLSYRTPPHIMHRDIGPLPSQLFGIAMRHVPARLADLIAYPARKLSVPDLTPYGLPDPGLGTYTRAKRGEIPILDVGLIDEIVARRVLPVPTVTGFDGARVLLADGSAIEADAVIAATGYRRGLEPLVGHLGVLEASGRPLVHRAATHADAPGLRFIGYTNPISGMFRELAIDAHLIARAIREELTGQPLSRTARAREFAARLTDALSASAGLLADRA